MSPGNVELVRRAYEAWNADGLDGLAPYLGDAVELVDPPEMPDSDSWPGRDAVLARLAEVAGAMGGGWVDLREVRSLGEHVVVSMVWQEEDTTDSPAFGEVFHVVTVAGDSIAQMRVFLREAAALDAAGG
jgi:ketosteroid isomerase-like protein